MGERVELEPWFGAMSTAVEEIRTYIATTTGGLWTPTLKPANFDRGRVPTPSTVESLLLLRRELLGGSLPAVDQSRAIDVGELLAYDPSQSLGDGGAEEITNGLVDANSCPPWELWVSWANGHLFRSARFGWFQTYLLAWIPPELKEAFSSAIWAESAYALSWFTDLDCRASTLLQS